MNVRAFKDLALLDTYFLVHSTFALTTGIISIGRGRGGKQTTVGKVMYQLPPFLLMLSSNPASSEYLVRRAGFPFCSLGKIIPAVKLLSQALHMHLFMLAPKS